MKAMLVILGFCVSLLPALSVADITIATYYPETQIDEVRGKIEDVQLTKHKGDLSVVVRTRSEELGTMNIIFNGSDLEHGRAYLRVYEIYEAAIRTNGVSPSLHIGFNVPKSAAIVPFN